MIEQWQIYDDDDDDDDDVCDDGMLVLHNLFLLCSFSLIYLFIFKIILDFKKKNYKVTKLTPKQKKRLKHATNVEIKYFFGAEEQKK